MTLEDIVRDIVHAELRKMGYVNNTPESLRIAAGKTIQDVFESCGVAPYTVSKIEQGKSKPRKETVKKISQALGVDERVYREAILNLK